MAEYETEVYAADDPAGLEAAIRLLCDGLPVVLPTDTVYGVGCDLWQPAAVERLFAAKGRPERMAIPVLVSGAEGVARVAADLPAGFGALAERYWPGGLTLIVPRRAEVPDILCAGGPTVAVRMPAQKAALRLIAALGGALAVTSANRSGQPAPHTAQGALVELGGRVPLVLDGGPCRGRAASTIVDLVSTPPRLLRHGELTAEMLRVVLPDLAE
jgi:L-threonylcarbamoyladenylate synthase